MDLQRQSRKTQASFSSPKFEGRFEEMVEREAVRLGVQFQVGGKWCSFVAVEANDRRPAEHVVPPTYAEGGIESQSAEISGAISVARGGGGFLSRSAGGKASFGGCSRSCGRATSHQELTSSAREVDAMSISPGAPPGPMPKRKIRLAQGLMGASVPGAQAQMQSQGSQQQQMQSLGSQQQQQQQQQFFMRSSSGASAPPPPPRLFLSGGDDSFGVSAGSLRDGNARGHSYAPAAFGAPAPFAAAPATAGSYGGGEYDEDDERKTVDMAGSDGSREMAKSHDNARAKRSILDSSMARLRSAVKKDDGSSVRAREKEKEERSGRLKMSGADAMQQLIELQTFEGFWEWKGQLFDGVGVGEREASVAADGTRWSKRCFATALAVAFLEGKMGGERETWELVVDKARTWLEGQVGAGSLENCLRDAGKLLK